MNNHELLLSCTTDEEKYKAANNIIESHNLPLSADQMLLAFNKVLNWLNLGVNLHNMEHCKKNRLFLFNKVLHLNENMYIAIILALCNDLKPNCLMDFIIFKNGEPYDIGLERSVGIFCIKYYYKLLDHYEFDVCNIQGISSENKQLIQDYRSMKYSGKLTKCAIKKID